MKKIIISLFLLLPFTSSAHVKWFAEEKAPIPAYSISDTPVVVWIIFSLLLIALGIYLEKKLKVPEKITRLFDKYSDAVLSIASIGFGLAFIIFSLNGFIFAPNLHASGVLGESMLALQVLLGIMILLGIYERLAGLLLIVLFALGIKEWGGIEMLDTLEIVGFAIYIMIVGRPKWKLAETHYIKNLVEKFRPYAIPILRVGTGLNLIVLGFTEKILNPSLTNSFLQNYHWNFMQSMGFESFSNYYFAFSAGMVEVLFGVFFLFGLITRTTTIALAVFLATTLILLGPVELVGHLPHFSIAIVLVLLGGGSKLKLF